MFKMIPLPYKLVLLAMVGAWAGLIWWDYKTTKEHYIAAQSEILGLRADKDRLADRIEAEIRISTRLSKLNKEVNNAPAHNGCNNPVIIDDALRRLHGLPTSTERSTAPAVAGISERSAGVYINEAAAAYCSCMKAGGWNDKICNNFGGDHGKK